MMREIFSSLKRNRLGCFSFWVLFFLYLGALFADFLAVYHYNNEDRRYSYLPPTRIHFFDSEKGIFFKPFIYQYKFKLDEYHRRIYFEDKSRAFPLKFLVQGDEYKFLGLFKTNIHLLGVDKPARLCLWGADSRGRDLFSRIIYGGRVSLSIGLFAAFISFSLGLIIGGISGYFGGRIDNLIMRLCEILMMVPFFYLMLALRAALPPDLSSTQIYIFMVLILSFIGWAGLARVIRGMVLSIKERDFVMSARALGLSKLKIITCHILPHTFSYVIVAISLSIPGYILGETGLSFLGLGIQDPVPSWGNLLSEILNIVKIKFYPWLLVPGGMIFLTVVCFNLLGDALRDILDPKRSFIK